MVESKRVLTKDGKVSNLRSGEKAEIIVNSKLPALLVDSHTHIQSGSCAPLPILWDRIPGRLEIPREPFNILSYGISPLAADIQKSETLKIGDKLVAEMEGTYRKAEDVSKKFYGERDIFSVAVVNMMDMEYGWIEGYKGERIYHEDGEKGRWYFYRRKSVREPKEKWEKVYLLGENERNFSKWNKQYFQTREAIINNPLRLLGMYHYDPRRWNYSRRERLEENLDKGPWDYPFNEIVSSKGDGIFIGFKMYPPLGYKPLDLRLKFLYDSSIEGDCFYGRCEREGIPIMVHCSIGGVRSYEYNLYMEYDGESKEVFIEEEMPDETRKRFFTAEGYFYMNYVHPSAWRKVLERYPKLKICLAHFGGEEWERGLESDWVREIISLTLEYENVYTDISCWNIDKVKKFFEEVIKSKRYVHLRDKILFGSDWYMPVIGWRTYSMFCEEFCKFFSEIESGIDLWNRFTFVNPIRFYGLFDKDEKGKDKIDYLYEKIKKEKNKMRKEAKENLERNYSILKEVSKSCESSVKERK